jgi:sugar lactone lactonase YvrE
MRRLSKKTAKETGLRRVYQWILRWPGPEGPRRLIYFLVLVVFILFVFMFPRKNIQKIIMTTNPAWTGASGYADGTGTAALFNQPEGVAVDFLGNVYVADTQNHLIRKVTSSGVVSTLAGSAGVTGATDGMGSAAKFHSPRGIAVDAAGSLYVADSSNHLIRKITSKGVVTTLAGSGSRGFANGIGTAVSFSDPAGVAVDSQGNVYVADEFNNMIRKITPSGRVTTLAGSGSQGHENGKGTAASFCYPVGISVDSSGNVYVADEVNDLVREIDPGGQVTTLAGVPGKGGTADGKGSKALFCYPNGIAADASGNLFVADCATHLIREIFIHGQVTTLAGSGDPGFADGKGSSALFNHPSGLALDASGNVYVADQNNHMIRKLNPRGEVTTLAGGGQALHQAPRGSPTP